jgi:hypothetical protein
VKDIGRDKKNLFNVSGVLECQQLVFALSLFVVKHSCSTSALQNEVYLIFFGQLQSPLFGSLDQLKAKEGAHSIKAVSWWDLNPLTYIPFRHGELVTPATPRLVLCCQLCLIL